MPRWGDDDAWDDDPEEDYPEEEQDDTMPCPHCGESVYDDAEQCPACGRYLSHEDEPYRKPWWLILGVAACLYVMLRGAFPGWFF